MKHILVRLAALTVLFIVLSLGATLAAQEANRAALVISLGDGEVITRCVQFSEAQISGFDLVSRAELVVETDVSGQGTGICRIEGTGCPATNCFCDCKGGDNCLYWSYWHQNEGEWKYSNVGAHLYQVGPGDVDGWVWGVGVPNKAPSPPNLSFEDICAAAEPANGETENVGQVAAESNTAAMAAPGSASSPSDLANPERAGGDSVVGNGEEKPASWPLALAGALVLAGLVALTRARMGRGAE